MKTTSQLLIFLLLLFSLSCKKEDEIYPVGYSDQIKQIVPSKIINEFIAGGMPIHPGLTPPNIQGIFAIDPLVLAADWDPNDKSKIGQLCACSAKVRFKNQSADNLTADADWKLGNDDPFDFEGAVSGEGNKFTFFAAWSGTFRGDPAKFVTVMSGEKGSNGLINFHDATYITENNNTPNSAAMVGQFRIRKDNDGLSIPINTF